MVDLEPESFLANDSYPQSLGGLFDLLSLSFKFPLRRRLG